MLGGKRMLKETGSLCMEVQSNLVLLYHISNKVALLLPAKLLLFWSLCSCSQACKLGETWGLYQPPLPNIQIHSHFPSTTHKNCRS